MLCLDSAFRNLFICSELSRLVLSGPAVRTVSPAFMLDKRPDSAGIVHARPCGLTDLIPHPNAKKGSEVSVARLMLDPLSTNMMTYL